jgi:hypothetical protein
MKFPAVGAGSETADRVHCGELMHSHENPNRKLLKNSPRKAALQIKAGSSDHLAVQGSGEVSGGVLSLICSL